MKRLTLSIFSTLLGVYTLYGQLNVNSTGRINAGNLNQTNYKMSVLGASSGIYCESDPAGTEYSSPYSHIVGITGSSPHRGVEYSFGIKGLAEGNSDGGSCYGVFGQASGGSYGYNYGVFGRVLPGTTGVGVFGTTSNSLYGNILSSSYAGYFMGNVKVTGTLYGIMLNNSLMSSSAVSSQNTLSRSGVVYQLQSLNAGSFFMEEPAMAAIDKKEDNTVVPKNGRITTEKQIYIKQHYGLYADQLEEVFPDLVYENEDGTKSINYVEMVPILVQAINELQSQIDAMKGKKDAGVKIVTGMNEKAESVQVMFLGQNKPNPFSTTTEVEVTVPESVQHAFVYVYDLNGKKVQQVDVTARGKQTVSINAATLEEGMYLYSLIADGQVVQTRRMIIEK